MADPGFSTSPTVLPNMFGSPGQSLDNYNRGLQHKNERQFEIDYRLRKDEELDQWRKLNLIQELTDLSKHKTGSDVADAIGHQLMSGVYQKYTQAAKDMSPIELQAKIQKEMGGIIGGMDAAKAELLEADKQMASMKTLYPELNHAQLYDDYRKDIVKRRLNDGVSDFRSPMEVQPSKFDFNNPETLAPYVAGDKALRDYFSNPQGVDDTFVFKGNNYAHTKYKGKITPWRKPNYDAATLKEGFLPSKAGEPKLLFKSSTIPSDAMPSSKGQPFEVIDEDVYRNSGLSGMNKLQLVSATKKKFPNYDNFNQEEKNLAQRNVFLEYAKNNDKTDFYPVDRNNPSAAMIKVWTGGSGGGAAGATTVDYYTPIAKWAGAVKEGHGAALSNLPSGSQSIVLKQARDLTGNNDLGQADIYIKKEGGQIIIKDAKTQAIIAPLDFGGVNIPANTPLGQKSKQNIAQQSQSQKPQSLDNTAAPPTSKMVTIEVNGKTGQIPEGKLAEFLKKYPNAKRK